MTVTLQYSHQGSFDTEHHDTQEAAIARAIELARHSNKTPLRILNENGAVIVPKLELNRLIAADIEDMPIQMPEPEPWETAVTEQDEVEEAKAKALEATPGFGTW
jgi:hypothetical protein